MKKSSAFVFRLSQTTACLLFGCVWVVCGTICTASFGWTPPETMPSDAILLFGQADDGTLVNRFLSKEGTPADWRVEDGTLISTSRRPVSEQDPVRSSHIFSEELFRDAEIHAEFMVSSENSGNSGLYIHGNYELQIMDSHGKPGIDSKNTAGAVYGIQAPKVNAARPAGVWQTLDILYIAPRRDAAGKIIQNGRITAWLNGQLIHEFTEFDEPVSHYHPFRYGATDHLRSLWQKQIETGFGPLFLQDHDSPVRFRNVWIRKIGE